MHKQIMAVVVMDTMFGKRGLEIRAIMHGCEIRAVMIRSSRSLFRYQIERK